MKTPTNYVIRVVDDPQSIDAAAWDALLHAQPSPSPFMQHAYLAAMHVSGSAVGATGWQPTFLLVHEAEALVGGCALYAKSHSYGEYVFDWSWAQAFERAGRAYYPKLLGAAPFTPVPGARLLARDDDVRDLLIAAIESLARQSDCSSAHVLFPDADDVAAFERAGWMIRRSVQFHWQQSDAAPYASFAAFTQDLQRVKRKKITQERRRVAESGVTFRIVEGRDIDAVEWNFFYRCYAQTYREHGSRPYLTRAFFADMADSMPDAWVMFVAERAGAAIAASLIAVSATTRQAYGRYWGAIEHVPLLHFEACYYQPIEWCIERGFLRFEGGAQGEHKMARGLLPVSTASAHWVADPAFAQAVAHFLSREGAGVAEYVDELNERTPFKAAVPGASP